MSEGVNEAGAQEAAPDAPARETLATDVLVVGAGPAGLSAAIRLKQAYPDLSVTVLEKSAEIGGHILSGGVMDVSGLDALIPDWRARDLPVGPDMVNETMRLLTRRGGFTVPKFLVPPPMRSEAGVVVSLGALCRWLGEEAERLGVDVFPMTAAVDLLLNADGAVTGVVTGDLGRGRDGRPKPGFAPGIALEANYTLLAEGARGSLTKAVLARYNLMQARSPQKFGLGLKEVWEVAEDRHKPGSVTHYLGFPLDDATAGGGFVYHADGRRVSIGLVVHLDYADPTISPFDEFQRFKTHPEIATLLSGATRLAYGARTVSAGGWQSIPRLAFPGGGVIGCGAGFMNTARLKAIHNAMLSGIGAADAVGAAIAAGRAHDVLETLDKHVLETGIEAELKPVRNVKPLWARFGTRLGSVLAGAELWCQAILGWSALGTLEHRRTDSASLKPRAKFDARRYPAPDNRLVFDRASSVYLANIVHDEDQPVHLRLADPDVPITRNLPIYGEPAPRYCPAGVYEVADVDGRPVFRIHAANCVHCKACDIKDPAQNITWVPPEGGSGPNYVEM